MLRHSIATLAAIALSSTMIIGQEPQPPAQVKPAEAPQAPPQARPQAQLVNVRIDVKVTEQREGGSMEPRIVTMLIADRESGRVRSGGTSAVLNVDARPEVTKDGRIKVMMSLEYRRQTDEGEKAAPALLTESLATILDDGKALVVSQSADPTSSRGAVRVEVTATISK